MNEIAAIEAEIQKICASDTQRPPHCAGPVPDTMIDEAERQLGLRFSRSYKAFLRTLGGGSFLGYEINGLSASAGVGAQESLFADVVHETLLARTPPVPYPTAWVTVMSDGGDYSYHLDTSKLNGDEECPIIANGPGADGIVIANDFLDFLRKLASGETLF